MNRNYSGEDVIGSRHMFKSFLQILTTKTRMNELVFVNRFQSTKENIFFSTEGGINF